MVEYRLAVKEDIDQVMEVIEDGRALLKEEGNGQWQFGYPCRDDLIRDIENKNLYVLIKDNRVVCCFALTYFEDAYEHLYEGGWSNNDPYMVLHRIAVKKEYLRQGLAKEAFRVFEEVAKKENIHSLRVDTHAKNLQLTTLMLSIGFKAIGKAILPPNKDRVMFEKLI